MISSTLSQTEAAALVQRFNDHALFAQESLRIQTKAGAVVPLILQPAQVKLNKAIRRQRERGLPVRIVYLKASQVMVSSGTAAQYFHTVPFFPGRHCLAVADSVAHAELVFRYYQGFQNHYQPFTGGIPGAQILLPELLNDRSERLEWENKSFVQVATGRNPHVGRSHPWQFVQFSEAAFIDQFQTLMDGTMQRVPNSPDTGVIVESTAFGEGGAFFELCQRAMDPRKAGGWQFVFFGWHEHPEYAVPVEDQRALLDDLSREELDLSEKLNLTLEQLAWRRQCIQNNCAGRVETFQQEFPSNPAEAFRSSGKMYLDIKSVERCSLEMEPLRGELEAVEVGNETRVQFLPRHTGRLAIYKRPQKGGKYVIGADSAQGKDPDLQKGGSTNPDYASLSVIDADTGEQVAKWRDRVTESVLGRVAYLLGQYYNWAFLVPEVVGAGRAFLQALLDQGYPIARIYRKERPAGDFRPVMFNELGFQTSEVTRPALLGALDTALLEGAIVIHDQNTIVEFRNFIRHPDGKLAAKPGQHDDDVFSHALAVFGLRSREARQAYKTPSANQSQPVGYGRARQRDEDDD